MRFDIDFKPLDFEYLKALAMWREGECDQEWLDAIEYGATVYVNGERIGVVTITPRPNDTVSLDGYTAARGRFVFAIATRVIGAAVSLAKEKYPDRRIIACFDKKDLNIERLCDSVGFKKLYTTETAVMMGV